jgi:hypothetical protein
MYRTITLYNIRNMKKYLLLFLFISFLGFSQTTKTVSFVIPSKIEVNGNVTITNVTAKNLIDGSINIIFKGGTGNYTYIWTKAGDNSFVSPINWSALGAGQYTITANDGKCSSDPYSFTIYEPELLKVNITTSNIILCYGGSGTLIATAEGGYPYSSSPITRNYTYKWYACTDIYGANPVEILNENLLELKNRATGFYQVEVSDQKKTTLSAPFELKQNDQIKVTNINKVDVKCKGDSTGSIELVIVGGSGSYKTTWTNLSFTTNKIENLPVGTYAYTIEDATSNGCKIFGSLAIGEPLVPLTLTTSQTQPTNGLNNGSITANASGGTSPYTYIFKNGATVLQNSASNSITGLPNGTYTVTVVDANGCTITSSNISLEALSVSITKTSLILCNSNTTGVLTAVASGGTLNIGASYMYQWYKNGAVLTNETNAVLSNLGIGTYKVEVKDSNVIAPVQDQVTLIEPTAISITETLKTKVNCYGGHDGNLKIEVIGGTPNNGAYTFILTGTGNITQTNTTATLTGLGAGNYTITVKDQYCSKDWNFTITQPSNPITISNPTITNVAIFGQSTGAIAFAPITGGNGNYTYSWTKVNDATFSSNTLDLSGLKAGRYTLTVKDNKSSVTDNAGCMATKIVDITENPELTVIIDEIQSISCYGANNGSLDVMIQGGVTPYKTDWYKLNSNTNLYELIISNQIEINDLVTGTYKIIVTDTANPSGPYASAEAIHVLGQPGLLVANFLSKADVLCFGDQTGIISINITGGTSPYKIQWNKNNVPYATTQNLTGLGNGVYTATITDKNNCTMAVPLPPITISQPTLPLQITSAVVTNLTGFETNNGAIAVVVNGGKPVYTYQWTKDINPAIIGTTATIANLAIGTYHLNVKDGNLCALPQVDYNVTQPVKLTITSIIQQQFTEIRCNGDKRAILEATITGGVPIVDLNGNSTYTYRWYNVLTPTTTISTANPTEALSAGTYALEVRDANNNTFVLQSPLIIEPLPLKIAFTQTNVSCKNGNDGAIAITISGGTGNYKILWSTGTNLNSNSITGLFASTVPYTVTVTDENNCQISKNVTITEPDLLYVKAVIKTPPSILGGNDGSIQIQVAGGTPNYNYYWYNDQKQLIYQDLNQSSDTSINNIFAGQYFITVTDANGCAIVEKDLDKIDPIAITLNQVNSIKCQGDATASVKASVTGGTPLYYYKWYKTTDSVNPISQVETLTNANAGTYFVIVTDSFGLSVTSNNIVVTEPTILNNDLTANYTLCGDANDWIITTNPTGGNATYTYLWNTGAKTSSLQDVPPGKYTVTVSDSNGCSVTRDITIIAPTPLATLEKITKPICYGGNNGSIVLATFGGLAPYSYFWDNGETQATRNNMSAGNYSVTITDAKGCAIVKSFSIINPPQNTINIGSDRTLCVGQNVDVDATIADVNATYSWTSLKGFTSNNPIITVTEADTYKVVVTNSLGCQATDDIVVSKANYIVDAQFAISSQAFVNEKIVIVDISKEEPDAVAWKLPVGATVYNNNKDYAEISFATVGEYEIGLETTKGSCTAYQTKKIIVIEGEYVNPDETDARKKFDITIYPNPTDGIFTADIKFEKIMPVTIKVFALNNNAVIDAKSDNGKDAYSFSFVLNNLTKGVYFILFESPEGRQLRKIIIN